MINEKLAQHISNELWVQKSKVMEVLERYSEEEPTIHAEKPSDIEERVKALETNKEMLYNILEKVYKILEEVGQRLEALENTPIVERKKRNLSIETETPVIHQK